MTAPEVFPFGQPVLPRSASADGPRPCFLLGAYPSAIHVRWTPPGGTKAVRAIPVENEPEPFWTGADEADHVQRWRTAVGFSDEWGTATPAGRLNGSSGRWVDDQILAPLGLARDKVWITDCLSTYRRSTGVHARIQRTYNPFATDEGLPVARLAQHPTEEDIVGEAVAERDRLQAELETAQPELIITAGRAALRVMAALVRVSGERPSLRVRPDGQSVGRAYGQPARVHVGHRPTMWLALAHPAAPPQYNKAHARWVNGILSGPPILNGQPSRSARPEASG